MEVIAIVAIVGLAAYVFLSDGGIGSLTGKLSASQIAIFAQSAGFDGSDLTMAVAVALAESGGDPNANGDTEITPGGSVGLWQINLRWHPEFAGQDLTNPLTNAVAAYSIYQTAGRSFTPWSTYNNGIPGNLLAEASSGVTEAQNA